MDFRLKIVVVVLPFLIAAYVGFSMLQPALQDCQTKDASISEKKTENDNLETKLNGAGKIKLKQKQLTDEIAQLRDAVPKAPDTDLLTIDLERMCKEAGMNMVAFNPTKETPGASASKPQDKEAALKAKTDRLKNMMKGGVANAAATAAGAAVAGAGAAGAAAAPPAPELSSISKEFIVTGDYDGLEKLVHEMETYQRVLKISDISFRVPKVASMKDKVKIDDAPLGEGEEGGDSRLLFITMTITTYYLP